MHEFDQVTRICKKCGLTKYSVLVMQNLQNALGTNHDLSCKGKPADEDEFVRHTEVIFDEPQPDAIVQTSAGADR